MTLKLTQKEIDEFVLDYEKLCAKHGVYIVRDGEIWLQSIGEQLDLDEAVADIKECIERGNT